MSHRKFHAPRHGSLGFLPRKRCKHHRGKIRSFPKSDPSKKPHLTAFIGYKAGVSHVLRHITRPGSKLHNKEKIEMVTILETPPMVGIGLVGYTKTPKGLRAYSTVWTKFVSEEASRRYYKNWHKSNKLAFSKHSHNYSDEKLKEQLELIKRNCSVVRLIAHTQTQKLRKGFRKAHILEIQINGGSVQEQVDFGVQFFEKEIPVDSVFSKDELVDTIGVTKGHGNEGVTHRWGTTRLPRKTRRGNRKVACIGAWHPARVSFTVARSGQNGYHHRTENNKCIYRIGQATSKGPNASTENDPTEKNITPMGGFPHYGIVDNEFVMIKGGIVGPQKRVITLRKALKISYKQSQKEEKIDLKFIDTSSKFGHGKFQTCEEKAAYFADRKN